MTSNYTFALFPTYRDKAMALAKAPAKAPEQASASAKVPAKVPAKAPAPAPEPAQQQEEQQEQQRQLLHQQWQPASYAKARAYVPSMADRFSMNRLIHYKSPGGCRSCS